MKRKRNVARRRGLQPGADVGDSASQSAKAAFRVRQLAFGITLIAAGMGPLAPCAETNLILRLIIQMFFVLAGMLWAISMALEGRARIRRTGLEAPLLLLAGALICGAVNASYKYPAVLTLFSWLSAMVAFIFVVNETRSRWRRTLLILVIGASTFVVSLHGLHQITVELPRARAVFAQDRNSVLRELRLPSDVAFDLEGRLGKDRVFGTFLLPNSLAGFLILVAPALFGLFLDWRASHRADLETELFSPAGASLQLSDGEGGGVGSVTRKIRFLTHFPHSALVLRAGLILPVLLALYFTKSKGGWLAFTLALGVFALWAFGKALWRRRAHVLCFCLGVLIVLALAQSSGLLPPLRDYFGSSFVRYGYWRAGISIFAEHPFVGVGLDNYADFYAAKKQPEDQEARRAHNDYLQIVAETGVIGLTMYAAFWLAFWRRVRRMVGEPVLAEPESRPFGAGGAASLLALGTGVVLLEALCGGGLRTSPGFGGWQWIFALWAGWAVFALVSAQDQNPLALGRASYATVGIGCGIVGFLAHSLVDFHHYVGGTLQTTWILMALLLSARMSEERELFIVDRKIGAGARLGCVVGASAVALFVLYGFVLRVAEAQALHDQAVDPTPNRAEDERRLALEEATRKNPLDAQNYALLSDLYLAQWLHGRRNAAESVSALSQAIVEAMKAVEIAPERSEYYTRLGRLHEIRWQELRLVQDYEEAMDAYRKAEELFPSNPDTALNLGRLYDLSRNYDFALGKYIRARRLSEEQYHLPRKFGYSNPAELQELDARIDALKTASVTHLLPPPLAFRQPRLLGWPRDIAAGNARSESLATSP